MGLSIPPRTGGMLFRHDMNSIPPQTMIELLQIFAVSLGMGLIMGLERERAEARSAGLRSFALAALLGSIAGLLAQRGAGAWLPAVSSIGLVALLIAAEWRDPQREENPGTTTGIALLLCHWLGALLWFAPSELVVALALGATALLYFKTELHGISRRISRNEWLSFLQFAAVAFVLLPLLPDRGYGPFDALNPYRIGLLVVLISGLSLASYAALKLLADRHAVAAVGLLGGVVSSTATTLAFSRHARSATVSGEIAALVVTLANLIVIVRLALLAAVMAPSLLPLILPVLAAGLIAGSVVPLRDWLRLPRTLPELPLDVKNPAELGPALGFALLFGTILVLTAWTQQAIGTSGMYVIAALSGLTDVDAISLSAMRLQQTGDLAANATVIVILIAYSANLAFKLSVVYSIGGRALGNSVLRGFSAALGGLLVGALLAL